MSTVTFFRQKRSDGGVRMGIDVNGSTVLTHFEEGSRHRDPALLWYVDVRCEGPRIPNDPEAARDWLVRHGPRIVAFLRKVAGEVPAGIDPTDWPFLRKAKVQPSGAQVTIACSAVRRAEAQEISRVLNEIADHWDDWVVGLAEVHR